MNFPIIPFQNNKGKNGAKVVAVPANTGINTSPAASLALLIIGTFPLLNIRCVFSITTIASSTIIPRPNKSANNTIKLSVTLPPTIASATGKNIKATNTLNGTLKATKKALVTPMKNIRINNTNMKPMMIVLISSLNEVFVPLL